MVLDNIKIMPTYDWNKPEFEKIPEHDSQGKVIGLIDGTKIIGYKIDNYIWTSNGKIVDPSMTRWDDEVKETYTNNSRNVNYPRITKCDRCKCYSYRYVDSRNCRICSS